MCSLGRKRRRSLKTREYQGFPDVHLCIWRRLAILGLPRAPRNSSAVSDVLSIQKFLQKSTDSAGLLILRRKPIVSLKKVALNFPPLEQGPARQEAAGTCFSPPAHELQQTPSNSLSAFHMAAS